MSGIIRIAESDLRSLLEEASYEGAVKALRFVSKPIKKEWVDTHEALSLLGKSRSTLERYVAQGMIKDNGQAYNKRRFLSRDVMKIIGG